MIINITGLISENRILKETLMKELSELGFDYSYRGTEYLIYMTEINYSLSAYENELDDLYEMTAQRYGINLKEVERSVRYAIYNAVFANKLFAWNMVSIDQMPSIFEFVETLTDRLKYHIIKPFDN